MIMYNQFCRQRLSCSSDIDDHSSRERSLGDFQLESISRIIENIALERELLYVWHCRDHRTTR